jgi:hypothetical protein
MTMIRKVMPLQTSETAPNRSRFVAATNQLARDGHILEPSGMQVENFLRGGTILFDHDSKSPVASPVAASLNAQGALEIEVEWPPEGVSPEADKVRGLVKAGVLRAGSVGFEPLDMTPLDPKKPRGGQRIMTSELLEFSVVSVGADTGAIVTQRSKEKSSMSEGKNVKDRGLKAKHTRALESAPKIPVFKRGLYDVAQLAHMLEHFGYMHSSSEYEALLEGDESPVPAMLGEALSQFGKALIAMTQEEVTELLAGNDLELDEPDETIIKVEERAYILEGKTPAVRAWRHGIAMARAGKTLSTTNAKKLDEAQGNCERAMKHHKALGEHNQAVSDQIDGAKASNDKAATANTQVGESLAAAKAEPEKAPEHVARALKAQKAIDGHLGDVADAHTNATDRCQDVGDAHNGIGRSIKSAQRCMRSVVDGSTPGEDSDSKDEQKSDGTDNDKDGSERSALVDYRRRQAEALALVAVD